MARVEVERLTHLVLARDEHMAIEAALVEMLEHGDRSLVEAHGDAGRSVLAALAAVRSS